MTHVQATLGVTNYSTTIQSGRHALIADEPASRGGLDTGPTPSDLLAASLAACTAITLRMYAEHKQWPLEAVHVGVELHRAADKSTSFDRVLRFEGPLSDEQRHRLADIAERTPVTMTLKTGAQIRTRLE